MTYRIAAFALALSLIGIAACNDSPTEPSDNAPKFTAALSPANEVPPVTNADATASGNATITFNLTKDAAGNITAATADFNVTLAGFPEGTTITAAHIHPGAAGTTGGQIWNLNLTAGDVPIVNGAGTIVRNNVLPSDIVHAQAIINNPSGYYFNVHTSLNTGGAVRGQLVKVD